MRSVTLTLIVHDHQPVGNFDHVIAQACDDAYDPFLGLLERHSRLRLAMHVSGPLLEWLAKHRREHLARLGALVARGQVEPWGGGFYEPVLSAIPKRDRQGQIALMGDWIEEELGVRPRGLWLTERVWEPDLPRTLARAGIAYTAVDDAHFFAAGFERDQLWGSWITEDQGEALRVLPIHRELRYAIPFQPPEKTIELLRAIADQGEGRIAVLGDDGEKFGVWPGTKETVWDQKWLERFAAALEAAPWVDVLPPGEAIERHAPLGLCYLPTASYHEMQEWALPPAAQRRHRAAKQALEPAFGERASDLLRGGAWRGFLARYPEANRLHKRMMRASRRLHDLPEHLPSWREARRALWKSQGNCVYWHGIFGGLYLPHLREALYRELILVERFLAPRSAHLERADFDLDGCEDALIEAREWGAWVSARGGALWAFDDRGRLRNWGDTLARRDEAYHDLLAGAGSSAGAAGSIHDAVRVTEPGLEKLAKRWDAHPRDSFLERWSEGGAAFEWAGERFEFLDTPPHEIALRAEEGAAPRLTKRYRAGADGALEVELALESARDRTGSLAVALNLGVHVPDAKDRYVLVNEKRATPAAFGACATHERVRSLALVDEWADARLDIATDRDATLARTPIETVSLSERGAERVFQGLEASFGFEVALQRGESWQVRFALRPGMPSTA